MPLPFDLLLKKKKRDGFALSEAAAHPIKISIDFCPSGAKIEDVALMRRVVGEQLGVKAAGGIREFQTAEKMIEAGATRLGASASIAIVEHKRAA